MTQGVYSILVKLVWFLHMRRFDEKWNRLLTDIRSRKTLPDEIRAFVARFDETLSIDEACKLIKDVWAACARDEVVRSTFPLSIKGGKIGVAEEGNLHQSYKVPDASRHLVDDFFNIHRGESCEPFTIDVFFMPPGLKLKSWQDYKGFLGARGAKPVEPVHAVLATQKMYSFVSDLKGHTLFPFEDGKILQCRKYRQRIIDMWGRYPIGDWSIRPQSSCSHSRIFVTGIVG
jgi:hypothetical protein